MLFPWEKIPSKGKDPFESEATAGCLELSTGPIRWIELTCWDFEPPRVRMDCYVPDPRITSDLPGVRVAPVRVRTFPLLGRVKAVKWKADKSSVLGPREESFGLHVATYLSHDIGLTDTIICAGRPFQYAGPDTVDDYVEYYCWTISRGDWGRHREWSKPLWDCYLATAEALLKMPIPRIE